MSVLREREVENRFFARARRRRGVPPLEGRPDELAALTRRVAAGGRGPGRAVLLLGEAGIGKSRLMLALSDEVAAGPGLTITLSCQPQFANTALQPVLALLRRSRGHPERQRPEMQFRKLGALLDGQPGRRPCASRALRGDAEDPAEGLYAPPAESPERQRQAFFAALAELMLGHGAGRAAAALRRGPALGRPDDARVRRQPARRHRRPPDAPSGDLPARRPDGAGRGSPGRGARPRGPRSGAVEAIVGRVTEGLHLSPEGQ